jgi:hypothetical protein
MQWRIWLCTYPREAYMARKLPYCAHSLSVTPSVLSDRKKVTHDKAQQIVEFVGTPARISFSLTSMVFEISRFRQYLKLRT